MATVFEPIRPVPPMTTIFMMDPPLQVLKDAKRRSARVRCDPSRDKALLDRCAAWQKRQQGSRDICSVCAALPCPVRYGRKPDASEDRAPERRCSSSVVEHSLGKGEVESSILSCSTRPRATPGAAMGRQPRRAGSLQDLSENSASEAAMTAEPMKNVGSMTKCKSAIQRESASDMSAVSAGTRFRNMVTKPLSPPVTVSATWYMTRPRDAAAIVPKIISPIAGS